MAWILAFVPRGSGHMTPDRRLTPVCPTDCVRANLLGRRRQFRLELGVSDIAPIRQNLIARPFTVMSRAVSPRVRILRPY